MCVVSAYKIIHMWVCDIRSYNSIADENWSVLECYAMLIVKSLMFQRSVVLTICQLAHITAEGFILSLATFAVILQAWHVTY